MATKEQERLVNLAKDLKIRPYHAHKADLLKRSSTFWDDFFNLAATSTPAEKELQRQIDIEITKMRKIAG